MRGRNQIGADLTSRVVNRASSSRQRLVQQLKSSISRRNSNAKVKSAEELFHVRVSRRVFALCWVGILLAHGVCAAYFTAASYLYSYIMPLSLGSNLRRYALRLPASSYDSVAYVHGVIAAPHIFCVFQMIVYSVYYRRLVFESAASSRISSTKITSILYSSVLYPKYFGRMGPKIFHWRKSLFGHAGLFGLGGQYFRTIFLCQEAVEIVLQTTQAYRMSCWLPRVWLNRLYVALLVFNCWSTTVIQRFTSSNPPLERLLVFLAGLLTDLASMIGVPVVLAIPYARIYNYDRGSFIRSYWYDDAWLINMVNECQIIMVTSIWDLLGKLLFSATLLMTFMVVKSLIRQEKARVGASARAEGPTRSAPSVEALSATPVETLDATPVEAFGSTPVEPFVSAPAKPTFNSSAPAQPLSRIFESIDNAAPIALNGSKQPRLPHVPTHSLIPGATQSASSRFFAFQDRLVSWGHRVFLLWGLLVLVTQIHADNLPTPALCGLQVRPWFQLKPSCSLLEVDCYKQNLTGKVDEIRAAMDKMNQPMLAHVVFRHCPNLEMPPNLKLLSQLTGFKIYNSTIARWEQDAALTNTNHQYLTFMFLVRVNMTEIPQGLQTTDYPKRLTDVEFSVTNLTTLPEDLHTKWPKGMALVLERAKFNHVPETLKYMQVGYLGFGENNVSEIPAEIFTHPYARSIWLNGNPITNLPEASVLPSLLRVRVINSNVSVQTLPEWVPNTLLTHATMNAGGTPLCAKIAELKAAGGDMSALGASLQKVYANVVCTALIGDLYTYYPLTLEDKFNA